MMEEQKQNKKISPQKDMENKYSACSHPVIIRGENIDKARSTPCTINHQPSTINRLSGRGYTLIEVVMSIVLMGIIASIFVATIIEGSRAYALIESQSEAAFCARFSIKRLLLECRNASLFTQADVNQLSFTNAYDESVVVKFENSSLLLSIDGGANFYPAAENVAAFSAAYYDNKGVPLDSPVATPSDIQSVSFQIRTEKNGVPFPVAGKVYLRTKPK